MVTDTKGTIEYANPKCLEVTGYTNKELMGRNASIFESGHHGKEFYNNMMNTIRAGKKWTGELYNKTKMETYYWEFAAIAPIFNKTGAITHYVKVSEDITEVKNAQQENIKSHKLESILEMAGAICHELNQPLQVISGYSEILAGKLDNDPLITRAMKNIVVNINRIADITRKLGKITEYKTVHYLDETHIIDINNQPE
jgi:PAS domain S-box-containing protein